MMGYTGEFEYGNENKGGKRMKYVCQICGYVYDDAKEKLSFE